MIKIASGGLVEIIIQNNMQNFIQILATIMGVVMSLGYYPQAFKIWKTKSSGDISVPSFIIFGLGTFTWLMYGIYINDWTIIISFVFGVVGSWLVLILSLLYKDTTKVLNGTEKN